MKRQLSLDEVKTIELNILKYLDKICQDNNIIYFIDFGTLLGAVRHKGFIPWDDDLDISLARDQYEKLYSILEKENHPIYKVISFKNNHNYPFPYFRIYDKRTYRDSHIRYKDVQLGTCVDVFAYDAYIDNKYHQNLINLMNKKRKLSSYTFEGIKNNNFKLKNFIRYTLMFIYRFSSTYNWNKKIEKLAKSYSLKTSKYCALTTYDAKCKPKLETAWLYDTINIEFCGEIFKAPKNYKKFLEYWYGKNYMELPPEKDRTIPNSTKTYIKI